MYGTLIVKKNLFKSASDVVAEWSSTVNSESVLTRQIYGLSVNKRKKRGIKYDTQSNFIIIFNYTNTSIYLCK